MVKLIKKQIKEYDNLFDAVVNTAYWTKSGTSTGGVGEDGGGIITSSGSANNSTSSIATSVFDLRDILSKRIIQFTCGISAGANSTTNSSASGEAHIKLTDGTNNQNLISATISTTLADTVRLTSGIYTITLILNGTNLNIRRGGTSLTAGNGGTGNPSIVTDDTDVDISGWTSLQLQLGTSASGTSQADGYSYSFVSCPIGTSTALGSKGTIY